MHEAIGQAILGGGAMALVGGTLWIIQFTLRRLWALTRRVFA